MSLPSSNPRGAQSSIKSFFQSKPPVYAPPPSSSSPAAVAAAAAATSAPPPRQDTAVSPAAVYSPQDTSMAQNSKNWAANGLQSPPLHPQATICPIEADHIPALRRITSLLLPVNYSDSFYASLSDPMSGGAFSRVVLWTDNDNKPKVIGGLVCRPEPSTFHPPSNNVSGPQPNALYIQSLVLLSPYRSLGLAAALLADVTQNAASSPWSCSVVYAHVWTDNTDGLSWYLRRGFNKEQEIHGYYFKLRPDSAWIVRRDIHGSGFSTSSLLSPPPPHSSSNNHNSTTAEAANLTGFSSPTPPVLATTAAVPPPPSSAASQPQRPSPAPARGKSFQNARPQTEWNDLPADMQQGSASLLSPGGGGGAAAAGGGQSGASSAASSRSSSAVGGRKKRDRSYPAAAFGQS